MLLSSKMLAAQIIALWELSCKPIDDLSSLNQHITEKVQRTEILSIL